MASSISSKQFTVCVVGGGAVGKSNLCMRFMYDQFQETYDPTIEDVYKKEFQMDDGSSVELRIVDTSGSDIYDFIRNSSFVSAHAFIFVISVTSKASLQEIETFWKQVTTTKESFDFPTIVVGNKIDLEDERLITKDDLLNIVKKFTNDRPPNSTSPKIDLIETSARTGKNVSLIFESIAQKTLDWHLSINPPNTDPEKKSSKKK